MQSTEEHVQLLCLCTYIVHRKRKVARETRKEDQRNKSGDPGHWHVVTLARRNLSWLVFSLSRSPGNYRRQDRNSRNTSFFCGISVCLLSRSMQPCALVSRIINTAVCLHEQSQSRASLPRSYSRVSDRFLAPAIDYETWNAGILWTLSTLIQSPSH